MEIRRVQMTGGSSYVLTLPKEWIHSQNIRKNDPLGVIAQEDGDLLITGNITDTVVQRMKIFEVETCEDPVFFFRCLVGAYIAGYNCIKIISKDRLSSQISRTIRQFTDQVIGLEPVEEHDTWIILRDLFNPLVMSFENSIKRMYVITKGMHADAIDVLYSRDIPLAQDVVLRDREVDRLYWLIARQANIILHYPRYGKQIHTPATQVMHFFQCGKIIERIADHSVLIARSIQEIDLDQLDEETISGLRAASEESIQTFDKSITTFFSNDLKKANRIIESVFQSKDTFQHINTGILLFPTQTALYLNKISGSIRRVEEYSSDIAELVINYEMRLNGQGNTES